MKNGRTAQIWQVTEGVCATHGGEGAAVYGVRVVCADGTVWYWADVSAHRDEAAALAVLMQEAQPEPCHWAELVEDHIVALSMG